MGTVFCSVCHGVAAYWMWRVKVWLPLAVGAYCMGTGSECSPGRSSCRPKCASWRRWSGHTPQSGCCSRSPVVYHNHSQGSREGLTEPFKQNRT